MSKRMAKVAEEQTRAIESGIKFGMKDAVEAEVDYILSRWRRQQSSELQQEHQFKYD